MIPLQNKVHYVIRMLWMIWKMAEKEKDKLLTGTGARKVQVHKPYCWVFKALHLKTKQP